MQNNNPSPPPTTRYIYDAAGHRTSRTDPNGHTITYAYDQVGRLTATTDPLGRQTTYRWDAEGHLVLATMPGSGDSATRGIALSYDILGREVGEDMGNGATIYAYNHDANNRLTSLADPAGLRTQAYDPRGKECVLPTIRRADIGTTAFDHGSRRSPSVTHDRRQIRAQLRRLV